jgi:uncharacterized membrane protein YhaH (DUF805 family)
MRGFDRKKFALYMFAGLVGYILLFLLFLLLDNYFFQNISMQTGDSVIYLLSLLLSCFWLWVHYQRLKNLNLSGWLLILAFIPVIGFVFFLYLLFTPPPK